MSVTGLRCLAGRWRPSLGALAIGALTLFGLSSCAWKVVPPRDAAEPVPVFVSEYGRHTRLALPDRTAAFFEYGFGEWNFYGLEKRGVFSALRAITGLGRGAFSRRKLPYTLEESRFVQAAGSRRSVRLFVERSRAEELRYELEGRWRANLRTVVIRAWDHIPVSPDRARYHLFHNSNQAVAGWLKRLGCRVIGCPITSNFQVVKESAAVERRSPQPPGGGTPW